MTKEELIALSDLNREDNIKYISSEAQGIAIALDSDRYAPTLCKLERAYICGRRKSEEQIEQLEKENAELKADNDARRFAMAMSEKVEKQLREENAELKGLKDVATLIRANNDTVVTLMQLNNKLVSKSQQLTNAKELLERLLITSCNSDVLNLLPNCSEVLRVRVEAEQFLKDSEVEK